MDGDAAWLRAGRPLHLARVDAGPHVEAELREGVADGEPAANRTRRPVEEREEAVAGGVDLLAAEAIELGSDRRIVPSEELRPRCVTELRRPLGRADEIGEEDGREDAVGRPASAARP